MTELEIAISNFDFGRFNELVKEKNVEISEHTLTIALKKKHPHFIDEVMKLGARPDDNTLTAALDMRHPAYIEQVIKLGAKPDQDSLVAANRFGHRGFLIKVTELITKEKNFSEIRKNSRLLSQGQRSETSFFSKLPDEILTKISSETGDSSAHNEKDSQKIAEDNLGKPSLK